MTTRDARRRSRLNQLYTALRHFGIGDRFELASLFDDEALPTVSVVCARLQRNTDALPPGISPEYLTTFLLAEIGQDEEGEQVAPAPPAVPTAVSPARALTAADAEEFDAILTGSTESREHADRYQNHVRRLLGGLFSGRLVDAGKEVKQFDIGRVDLVFRNAASTGFFDEVARRTPTRGLYLPVECKNEGGDPKPGAFQQLAARLEPTFGTLGMLACRRVIDREKALRRSARFVRQDKWMIVLTDADFRQMLNAHLAGDLEGVEAPLYVQHQRLARR